MSKGDDHFSNFILFLILGGLGVAGVLYVLFLFWPYVVFYILPFAAATFLVGWVLRIAIAHMEGGGTIEGGYDGKQYHPMFQYERLLVVFPVMIFTALLVFEMNSVQTVQVDKKGKVVGKLLEWPGVYKTFNEWRTSTYADSPFDSLKEAAHEEVLYDRRQVGWIVWFALFLGGPLYCWWLSRKDFEVEGRWLYKQIDERTQELKESLRRQISDQDKIVASKVAKFQEEVERLKAASAVVMAENQRLKATVEFSSEVPKPLTDPKKKGVLDGDLF